MMRAQTFLVLCTLRSVWTIDIFIDGPVLLRDCRSHDGTKTFESTTTSHPNEASESPKAASEGHTIISVGNEEFLVVTTQRLWWDEARNWCKQHWRGDLASPSDPRALADQLYGEGRPSWGYWVGGQRRNGGSFSWVNGQSITDRWASDEPHDGLDCVYLYSYESGEPLWKYYCDDSYFFICER